MAKRLRGRHWLWAAGVTSDVWIRFGNWRLGNDGTSHFAGRSVTGGRSMFIELGRAMKSIWIMGKGWERNGFL